VSAVHVDPELDRSNSLLVPVFWMTIRRLKLFQELERINQRPRPFETYTAADLWTDEHTSARMLDLHLDGSVDVSSRQTQFIDRSVEWIASRFEVGRETKIADFGCGPGLYTSRLARRGARVTGIDFSPRSIDYAKQVAALEHLDIHYVTQDYLDFDTEERFDLVLMIMCDFCALNPAQRGRMLSKFHRILKRGGSVLLDVYSITDFEQIRETATYAPNMFDGFWSPQDYFCFKNTFRYPAERVVLEKYTVVEMERTRTVYNWFQYFTPESLKQEFLESDLSTEEFYSDVAGTPYQPQSREFAVVATK
jgi:SAM-dependent methyltransferase